jgi:hypothetical protein
MPVVDTFWVDKQTFLLLKAEQNAGPEGTIVYEVTSVAYDPSLPNSLIQYTPPGGAELLPSPVDIKRALQGR